MPGAEDVPGGEDTVPGAGGTTRIGTKPGAGDFANHAYTEPGGGGVTGDAGTKHGARDVIGDAYTEHEAESGAERDRYCEYETWNDERGQWCAIRGRDVEKER